MRQYTPMTQINRPVLLEIVSAFLRLGVTSFGGPIAHLGYFRSELIQRRRWISDDSYAEILALSQFLPGPASSQVAFALGWQRGGFAGALLATLAFTLPSALTMILLAALAGSTPPETGLAGGLVAGLKITAVAVVAHAVLGMARSLAPTGARAGIALAALAIIALLPAEAVVQVAAILLGAGLGFAFRVAPPLREMATPPLRALTRKGGAYCLAAFAVLLIGLPLLAAIGWPVKLADIFYRAGALVFGGGHVVLPLLQNGTQGLVSDASFLAGYGAAQAMPGPLFTFAGWLGQVTGGLPGALIALAAIFLPGFLLMAGAMPFWAVLSRIGNARHAMAGANAAVVGILGHALYDPVFTSGIRGNVDLALAVTLFLMLGLWSRPAWQVVIAGALGGVALSGLA